MSVRTLRRMVGRTGTDHAREGRSVAGRSKSTLFSRSRPAPLRDGYCTRAAVPGTSYETIPSAAFDAIAAMIPIG
jgi:hypothetical protein